jgi:hypothetical protein
LTILKKEKRKYFHLKAQTAFANPEIESKAEMSKKD